MIDLSSIFAGSGAAILGFVGGAVHQRTSREGRFEKRIDAELAVLRAEVESCRKERPLLQIVVMGAGMMAGELRRKDPDNPTLKVVADAFAALPLEREDFSALLEQLSGDDDAGHDPALKPHP